MKKTFFLVASGLICVNISCQMDIIHSPSAIESRTDIFLTPVITSETKHPDLPKILVPGLKLKLFFANKNPGYKDGPLTDAQFSSGVSMTKDLHGNFYLADIYNHRIRKLSPDGKVTSIAGTGKPGVKTGSALEAQFDHPGNIVFVAPDNFYIQQRGSVAKLDLVKNEVSLFAIDSTLAQLAQDKFNAPVNFGDKYIGGFDHFNGNFYFSGGREIFKVNSNAGMTHYAGTSLWLDLLEPPFKDGSAKEALFESPSNWAFDSQENMYVGDNCRIRKISHDNQTVTTLVGSSKKKTVHVGFGEFDCKIVDGSKEIAQLGNPYALTNLSDENILFSDTAVSQSNGETTFSGIRAFINGKV